MLVKNKTTQFRKERIKNMNIKETTEHLFWLKYEAIKKFVEEVFTVKEIDEIEKRCFRVAI